MMIRDGARPRRVPFFTFYEPGDHLPLRLVDAAARQEVRRYRVRGRNLMQARAEAVSMMCCATAMLKIRLDSSGTASDATSRLNLLYLTRPVTHDAQVR